MLACTPSGPCILVAHTDGTAVINVALELKHGTICGACNATIFSRATRYSAAGSSNSRSWYKV
jgi:hypothetical protein